MPDPTPDALAAPRRRTRTIRPPEYRVWENMRNRCLSPRNHAYARYGGRGIRVCPQWDSFQRFLGDMGPRPSASHTLDRIDNDLGYGPDNCRWATRVEQQRNKRNTHWLTCWGRTQSLAAWAEERGIKAGTLSLRLQKGWPAEQALDTGDHRGDGVVCGERHGASKVTTATVTAIRKDHSDGIPLAALAKKYGARRSNIEKIVYRTAWKHLQ